MARIRTVKPGFWRHEELSNLPEATILLALGLLNYVDDEGYFNANPGLIKADCCPLREPSVSIHDSLMQLEKIGWIRLCVADDGRTYGKITTFAEHQIINRKTKSKIKDLVEHSLSHHTQLSECSLLEREREEEREGKGIKIHAAVSATRPKKPVSAKSGPVWEAYAGAYRQRYRAEPVRNAKVNSLLAQLVDRLGSDDAPEVAAFFVTHNNGFYVTKGHAVGILLADAEKLRTEWATGRRITQTAARQADATETNRETHLGALAILQQKGLA